MLILIKYRGSFAKFPRVGWYRLRRRAAAALNTAEGSRPGRTGTSRHRGRRRRSTAPSPMIASTTRIRASEEKLQMEGKDPLTIMRR